LRKQISLAHSDQRARPWRASPQKKRSGSMALMTTGSSSVLRAARAALEHARRSPGGRAACASARHPSGAGLGASARVLPCAHGLAHGGQPLNALCVSYACIWLLLGDRRPAHEQTRRAPAEHAVSLDQTCSRRHARPTRLPQQLARHACMKPDACACARWARARASRAPGVVAYGDQPHIRRPPERRLERRPVADLRARRPHGSARRAGPRPLCLKGGRPSSHVC